MKKLFSYFQHSILIMFVVLAGILSCEELEDGIANSLSDTVSIFDTVSVSDTVSILDTLFYVDSMGYDAVGDWEGVYFIEENDTFNHIDDDSSWVWLTLTTPTIIKPLHEFYFRDWEYGEDTFKSRGVWAILGDSMYVYQLWNNEDGGPGPDEDDWDLMRLGYDLNASKDTVTLTQQWMEDYGPDSGTVYNDKYVFKRL